MYVYIIIHACLDLLFTHAFVYAYVYRGLFSYIFLVTQLHGPSSRVAPEQVEIVRSLLLARSDPNKEDRYRQTSLISAVHVGCVEAWSSLKRFKLVCFLS